jgi:hypothetical protein
MQLLAEQQLLVELVQLLELVELVQPVDPQWLMEM